jgi:hypothetical protein
MRDVKERLGALQALGTELATLGREQIAEVGEEAHRRNPWFTPDMVAKAIEGLQRYLETEKLKNGWPVTSSQCGKSPCR